MVVALRADINWCAAASCQRLADAHALCRFGADGQSWD